MAAIQITPQAVEVPTSQIGKANARKPQSSSNKVYDLICVGFGTAALGLAVALQHGDNKDSKVLFLESKSEFEQSANSDKKHMETCFAQDLATTRDPTSKFTFLNYLYTQGKLEAFMSLFAESPYPQRVDFNDYLAWAASQFENCVEYGQEAVAVLPVSSRAFPLNLWTVTSRDVTTQTTKVFAARNVIMATGGEARIVQHPSKVPEESESLQMLEVADGLRDICKPTGSATNDALFANLVTKSDEVLKDAFFEEPLEMMRAML